MFILHKYATIALKFAYSSLVNTPIQCEILWDEITNTSMLPKEKPENPFKKCVFNNVCLKELKMCVFKSCVFKDAPADSQVKLP